MTLKQLIGTTNSEMRTSRAYDMYSASINYDKNIRKCPDSVRCPRIPGYFGTCADSVYKSPLFPPLREARASSYAGKIGTGDEANRLQAYTQT